MSTTAHILLVDDDADLRQCLVDVLEDAGYLVKTASSGREALRLLAGGDLPGLILLDLMMPDLNGWQFYEEKQKIGRLASIPVLVVTASRALGASFPGSEVLLKPFSVETVVEKVEQLVSRVNN
jgi:CheY-like chemotaxis protein